MAIKVKIIKESKDKLTLYILATHRAMPVKRAVFEERVEAGEYEVITLPKPAVEEEKEEEDDE